jgi:hypothetical protein
MAEMSQLTNSGTVQGDEMAQSARNPAMKEAKYRRKSMERLKVC